MSQSADPAATLTDVCQPSLPISLQEHERQFRTIFEHLAIGVAVQELSGCIVECNPALQQLLGYSREELRGATLAQFSHLDDQKIEHRARREMETGRRDHYQIEQRYLCKNGEVIWGRVTVSRISGEDGQPLFLTCLLEDVTERKQVEEELRQLLFTDELTGLYNRRGLFMLAEQQERLAARKRHTLLLVYADIDNMKHINDKHGHASGDLALVESATILRAVFRASDIIARIGGDEFVALAIEAPGESAVIIRNRLQEKLAARNAQPHRFTLSLSCGMVPFEHGNKKSIQDLLNQADLAMYTEKQEKHHT